MRHRRLLSARRLAGLGIAAAGALAVATATASPAAATASPPAASGDIVDVGGPNAIPGSYIVVFKDSAVNTHGLSALTNTAASKAAAKVERRYVAALHGFAGTMSETAARRLAADPDVAYVAQNHMVHLLADQTNPPSWGLDCSGSGSFAGVAQGIDYVTAQHAAGAPAVANMSLGAQGSDTTTENAVRNSIADGVTYAIASGNSNANACNFTPARVTEAITVNASDINDARASFSNFGTCTDIFAPGVNITSSWNTSDTASNTISGTSMATPHVAGGAAVYLSANPSASPATVQQALKDNATLNHITNPGTGSPNRLLYTLSGATGNPVVSNPGNRTGTVGTATSLQMTASGGTPPYTWSATGLPTGLSINSSTGLISGTPTVVGTYNVTVTAQDTGARTGSTSFTWTITSGGGCSSPGQKLANPGFESGAVSWSATSGVIGQWGSSGEPPHSGTWNAWLDGYGITHTDTLSQSVTIPSACTSYTLSFWLHIDTAETTTSIAYDKLTVQLGSTTLATYSNLNHASGYSQKTFNVAGFAGQTVTLKFTGTEDISLQTSFVIDDTALNVG